MKSMRPQDLTKNEVSLQEKIAFGLFTAAAIATSLYLFLKKKKFRLSRPAGKRVDIEIRYETDKDASAVLLAQNIVKAIRIVLAPIGPRVLREDARLIFVLTGDSWEMRVRNGSEQLKRSVRQLLEAKEW